MSINGHEFPSPLRSAPKIHSVYYFPHISESNEIDWAVWRDNKIDNLRLNRNLIHENKRDAKLHALALLALIDEAAGGN